MFVSTFRLVVIGDDVEIGANATIDRARFGKTVIGEGSKIDNLVQLGHNVKIGKHCLVISQAGVAGSTKLGNYVTVAAQSGISGHLTIGDQAVLAAKSGITKSLKGGIVYAGFPARPMREDGKRQAGLSRIPQLVKDVKEIKKQLNDQSS